MRHRLSALLPAGAFLFACALAACGGGNAIRSAVAPPPASVTSALATVNFTIQIPGRSGSSSERTAQYVGAATQSATFIATPSTGTPYPPVTVNCTSVCQASLSVTPGNDTFTVSLYDGQNGAGNVLSSGTVKATIVLGQANTVNVVFNGIVYKVVIAIQPPTIPVGTATSVPVIVQAEDKDGNIIVGSAPYNVPITLSNSDTSGATTLSATTVTQPLTPITIAYNGATTINQVTISGSASGIAKTATAVLGISGGGTPIPSANPVDPALPTPKIGAATPAPTPTAVPSARPSAAISAAPQGPVAAMQVSGNNLEGFINTASKSATLIINSQTNVGSFTDAIPAANFQVVTNTTLAPLSLRPANVVDMNALRMQHVVRQPSHFDQPLRPNPLDGLRPVGGADSTRRVRAVPSPLPTVGATANFTITGVNQSGDNVSIPFTLVGITPSKVYVWFDNTIASDANGSLSTIMSSIDTAYATITRTFGSTSFPANAAGIKSYGSCDASGNQTGQTAPAVIADPGVTYAIITRPLASALGYFWSQDYDQQIILNCLNPRPAGNESPMSVTAWTGSSTAQKLYNLRSTYTHELMHQVQFIQKNLINAGTNEVSWLAEGLGTYSQDLTAPGGIDTDGGGIVSVQPFLQAPQNYSFTGFAGVENGRIARGNSTVYGLAYLFVSYLTDRFGPQIPAQLLTAKTAGVDTVTAVTGTPFNQLLSDFSVALMLSNTGVTTDPRFTFKTLNMRGTYASQVNGTSITLTGPATISTLSAGQPTEFINMYQNGFAYFTFNGLGNNAFGVKVNDQGNGALQLSGTISQQ